MRALIKPLTRLMVFVLVLAHGWSAVANAASRSHDPLQWSGHHHARLLASLSTGHDHVIGHLEAQRDQAHGHGHGHDDHEAGPEAPESGSAPHGHHSADHSHDSPNLPQVSTWPPPMTLELWQASYHVSDPPQRAWRLERPPKHLPI